MAILPVDIQALFVRMDHISKLAQVQQEGIAIAQSVKGSELGELAQVQSSRVNELKPHPDNDSKIEDEQKKQRKPPLPQRKQGKGKKQSRDNKQFDEPFKGTHIDTER
jgi:hypothetical protein